MSFCKIYGLVGQWSLKAELFIIIHSLTWHPSMGTEVRWGICVQFWALEFRGQITLQNAVKVKRQLGYGNTYCVIQCNEVVLTRLGLKMRPRLKRVFLLLNLCTEHHALVCNIVWLWSCAKDNVRSSTVCSVHCCIHLLISGIFWPPAQTSPNFLLIIIKTSDILVISTISLCITDKQSKWCYCRRLTYQWWCRCCQWLAGMPAVGLGDARPSFR